MDVTPRTLAGAALAVATALGLAACGGVADDAPTDADVAEFCEAFNNVDLASEEAAQAMIDVGTPEDVGEEVRRGFEAYVDGLYDEGTTQRSALQTIDVPEDQQAAGLAFTAYAAETCTPVPGAPTDAPS